MKVCLVCGVACETERRQAMLLFRELSARGNDVSLLAGFGSFGEKIDFGKSRIVMPSFVLVRKTKDLGDFSVFPMDLSGYLNQMHLVHVLDLIENAEATLIITDEHHSLLTQILQQLLKIAAKTLDGNKYVWNHEGMTCSILGGSIRKQKVAREMFEILNYENKLDLTDIFPYGSPRLYPVDPEQETPGPCVM